MLLRIAWVPVLVLALCAPTSEQRGPHPSSPVRIIVGFPHGGGVDVLARALGQKMAAIWAQLVVVENRPAAASIVGMRLAIRATPDGHADCDFD